MCGIVGIWNLDGKTVERETLRKFTHALAHRGPDGEGVYTDQELGLGHRWLQIVTSAETGRQPMAYAGRFWITFNGEIYNYREIRRELEAHGHRFVTDTDTEVVLAAFAEWGVDCQLRFNGMWAFAVWDASERQLVLCRDRFGIKPLFYCLDEKRLSFASELKAFLHLKDFALDVDAQFIADDLVSQGSADATDRTFLKKVTRLLPGHCLVVRKDAAPRLCRWWNTLDHLEPGARTTDYGAQVERFEELFVDACRIAGNMGSRFGTTLSGGLDSSSVTNTMSRLFPQGDALYSRVAIHSYFPDGDVDERSFAKAGADRAGVDLRVRTYDGAAAVAEIEQAIFDYEDSKGCPSARWLTYRELRRNGLTVTVEGEGADELLAGYEFYPRFGIQSALWPVPRLGRIRNLQRIYTDLVGPKRARGQYPSVRRALQALVFQGLGDLSGRVDRRLDGAGAAWTYWNRLHRTLSPRRGMFDWLAIEPRPFAFAPYRDDRKLIGGARQLDKRLYWDFHCGLLPNILRSVDRCSMAHGVEVRVPFLDWRLVCYAFSLPEESKMGDGYSKRILRSAMSERLPDELIRRRQKTPFQTPMARWILGPAREFFLASLDSQEFLQSEVWNGQKVRRDVLAGLQAGQTGPALASWNLVQSMHLKRLFTAQWTAANAGNAP